MRRDRYHPTWGTGTLFLFFLKHCLACSRTTAPFPYLLTHPDGREHPARLTPPRCSPLRPGCSGLCFPLTHHGVPPAGESHGAAAAAAAALPALPGPARPGPGRVQGGARRGAAPPPGPRGTGGSSERHRRPPHTPPRSPGPALPPRALTCRWRATAAGFPLLPAPRAAGAARSLPFLPGPARGAVGPAWGDTSPWWDGVESVFFIFFF